MKKTASGFACDPYNPDLMEIIDDTRSLVITGGAALTPDGRNFAGAFSGTFKMLPRTTSITPSCSGSGQLTLTR